MIKESMAVKTDDRSESVHVLQESESHYRRLFETAQDGILILDADTGKIIDVNPFLINIMGYPYEVFLGKELWEIGLFKDIVASKAAFLELQAQGYVRYEDLPLKTKDGRSIDVEFVSNVYLANNKNVIQCNIRDITERRKVEKVSLEARRYAENIIETVREPFVVLDKELKVLSANHSFYSTFEVTSDETVGNLIYDIGNKQWNIPLLRTLLEEILPKKTEFINYEVSHKFQTIGQKIMLLNARQIYQEVIGTPIILLAIEDITEKRRIEILSLEARRYAENIIETVREPFVVLDKELKVLSANHSFYSTFEVTSDETVGNLIYDIGNKQWNIPSLRTLLEEILPKKTEFINYEVSHKFQTIGQKIMLLNARQIYQEVIGTPIILLAIEDITQRRKMEIELKESESRYRRLFESAQDGILILEADTGKIVEINPFLINILGYTYEDFLGKELWEIGLFKNIEASKAAFLELQTQGYVRYEDLPLRTKDGRSIDVEFVSNVYLVDNKNVIQCNIRDISKRKKWEKMLSLQARITSTFITFSDDEIFEEALKVILEVMQSTVGTFGYLDKDGTLVIPSITRNIWEACSVQEKTLKFPRETWGNSSWVHSILEKRLMYSNEASTNIPEGHIPISRNISLPILFQGEVIGLIEVANKETDYTESDLCTLSMVANHVAPILDARLRQQYAEKEEKRTREDLQKSNAMLMNAELIGNMGSWEWNITTNEMKWSQEVYRICGLEPVIDCNKFEIMANTLSSDCKNDFLKDIDKAMYNGKLFEGEYNIIRPDGEKRYIYAKGEVFRDDKGKPVTMSGILHDITEGKKSYIQIKASLKEKEILLQEIHHRVKNNMQIISSLLRLQSRYIKNDKYRSIFQESQNMILSMSLIHEKLYHSHNISRINFKEYIKDLVKSLFLSFNVNESAIKSKINIEDVSIGMDMAIPCGLIINELITNSIKYAFPDGRKGEINIAFSKNNSNICELSVGDNGIGISEYLDIENSDTLGLRLVNILVNEQLEGEVDLKRNSGTKFSIKFKGEN